MIPLLTIGGSDPVAGAGVQMDLKVFSSLGAYGLSVVTAVTAQNTQRYLTTYSLPYEIIEAQFEAVLSDIKPQGAKTGMLYSKDAVECVIKNIKKFNIQNLVIDPVILSSTGAKLIDEKAFEILKNELIPLSKAVTANILEAEALTGVKISSIEDLFESARKLYFLGTKLAVVKGGHFNENVPDVLYDGDNFYKFESEKIRGEFHGTGCAFSSAFLFFLCNGFSPENALKASKEFVKRAIINSLKLGKGLSLLIF